MSKVIITVVGKDTVGIIAKVCTYLAGKQVNILDISQTIVQDYFNMMMIADMEHATGSFDEVATELEKVGEEIGVNLHQDAPHLIKRQKERGYSHVEYV